MVLCMQVEKIRRCLEAVPPLMDRYQRKEVSFPDHVIKWLEDAEKNIASLRLPQVSELATLRGNVLKVEDSLSSGDDRPSRSSVRRASNSTAADSLSRAESILRDQLNTAEDKLKQFEDKLCEGMTAFLLQNTLPPMAGMSRQTWLLYVWEDIRRFQATRPLALYLATSLTQVDRCFILDEILNRMSDWNASRYANPEVSDNPDDHSE
jgi:hypothetical protein